MINNSKELSHIKSELNQLYKNQNKHVIKIKSTEFNNYYLNKSNLNNYSKINDNDSNINNDSHMNNSNNSHNYNKNFNKNFNESKLNFD